MLNGFRNGVCGISDGLNGLVGSLLQFLLARADHHAHDSASQHSNADSAHKTTAFHHITPCVFCPKNGKNTLPFYCIDEEIYIAK